jgi:hypothetical protein
MGCGSSWGFWRRLGLQIIRRNRACELLSAWDQFWEFPATFKVLPANPSMVLAIARRWSSCQLEMPPLAENPT